MSNELLIIYNTCGINGNDSTRLDKYIESIHSILNQEFEHEINICISSCLNSDSIIGTIQDHFFDSVDICRIQEDMPPDVCFNKTAQECVKRYGNYIGYLFVNSEKVLKHRFMLKSLWNSYKKDYLELIFNNLWIMLPRNGLDLYVCDIFKNSKNEVIRTDIAVNYDGIKGEFWQKV